MGKQNIVDLFEFHKWLWTYRARGDFCQLNREQIAEKLGCTVRSISNWFNLMEEAGYIERTTFKHPKATIKMNDPALFEWLPKNKRGLPIKEEE